MPDSHTSSLHQELRAHLPQLMRDQLNHDTQSRAYFLLTMLSDDPCIDQLRDLLQEQYPARPISKTPLDQARDLISQLQKQPCDPLTPFKYRLPHFLGEYPIHSSVINSAISQFNQLIEAYHADEFHQELDPSALNKAYQNILDAIQKHDIGCNINSLWQLLRAITGWSTAPVGKLLANHPNLLSPITPAKKPDQQPSTPLTQKPVAPINQPIPANRKTEAPPFTTNFDYLINEAGRIEEQSVYISIHGFALKPGGHADAIVKKIPHFMPWSQWQCILRRQLSQIIDLPLDDVFFDWLQTVLQRLGVEFVTLKSSSYECYVSPFLNHKTLLHTLNEETIIGILHEQSNQANSTIDPALFPVISRFLIRFLYPFQFNRGEALGIGANWGGVISDANEAGTDGFRFNDSEWAAQFRNLSLHRQGPAEAHMNAAIGIKCELWALLSSFEYITQLQPSEYENTLFNALVDNLITAFFPEPPYFENETYVKYRRHEVVTHTDNGLPHIKTFYQPDPQGTYYKTKKGEYKQTPMFRQAGSLTIAPFPRDTGSGASFQSLLAANPLWPLQLQYAQSASTGVRGHLVYNPIGPDEFIPDTFYGQVIREADGVYIPFIGVIPKNFDTHFNQEELCASFVVRMLQSSRLMTYCPAFHAYYLAIASRFLPSLDKKTPVLPSLVAQEIKRKWHALDKALHDPNRTTELCNGTFFSLFKELVYSLYSQAKDDPDLHYYFVELTTSAQAFDPRNRATCERLIRDLMTLKPSYHVKSIQHYEMIVQYLQDLTDFFYPHPSDETAKAIAQQAKLHAKLLMTVPQIKEYFADLKQIKVANLATKISPGLMHDALKYQAPSPNIHEDFYNRRHTTNFQSGYRDVDGNQIVRPTARESMLDFVTKTGGALLPLIRRNKTFFSLLTQPFAQAYIASKETYSTEEDYKLKLLKAIASGLGGFVYGIGLGAEHALGSIPRAIYNSWVSTEPKRHKANHVLAISSAPSNEPGLRVEAVMDIRDRLLQLMATANSHIPSSEELIQRLLVHVEKIHPTLLTKKVTQKTHYKQILLETFPLSPAEWEVLFKPVIDARDDGNLQDLINQHILQIDRIFIYALYECLTAANCDTDHQQVIKKVIEKHKLNAPQDQALDAFVHYYVNDPQAKRQDIAQYRFQGPALTQLYKKELLLRKIQTWINKALDMQWGLEELLSRFMHQYRFNLNPNTLADIVAELPESIKEVLTELISTSKNPEFIIRNYQLDKPQREFLLECAGCYQKIISPSDKKTILEKLGMHQTDEVSVSIKAREHLKFTQFIHREWQHQLLSKDTMESMVHELKKIIGLHYHQLLDELVKLYEAGLADPENPMAFDAFYNAAMTLQNESDAASPLNEWVNVTMNGFMNRLLDETAWTNEKKLKNPLCQSPALMHWLNHLVAQKHEVRALLAQQIEQAPSFDLAAWRCQHILHALETSKPNQGYIRDTGMQKLWRIICQNSLTITTTGEQKPKDLSIEALCRYSITMQHALKRVREKIPASDLARTFEFGNPTREL